MCVCMHMCVHVCICECKQACVCLCLSVGICVGVGVCLCASLCICTHMHMCMHTRIRVCLRMYGHTCGSMWTVSHCLFTGRLSTSYFLYISGTESCPPTKLTIRHVLKGSTGNTVKACYLPSWHRWQLKLCSLYPLPDLLFHPNIFTTTYSVKTIINIK